MRKLSYTLLVLLLILAGISEYFIQFALKPALNHREAPAWMDSLITCGAMRDTFLLSQDSGDSIHAWYLRAQPTTDKVAILVHGYSDNSFGMGSYASIYRQLHYNLILPDLHYHGGSKGEYIQMGWRDRLDVLQWSAMADSLFGGHTRQVLHGVSMGAATVMSVSGEDLPPYIKCFVEDCGYTSVWDEFTNELKNQFNLPAFPILYTTSWLNKLQNGWSFREASPLKQVAKCRLPMLFIHGGDDTYVRTEMVYRLYDAKPAPKQIHVFEGSAHAKSCHDHPQEYAALVSGFVSKYTD